MSVPPYARISSGWLELSTLITSAPRNASSLPAYGPAHTLVSSTIRTPSSGPPRDTLGGLSCGDLTTGVARGIEALRRISSVCSPRTGAALMMRAGDALNR